MRKRLHREVNVPVTFYVYNKSESNENSWKSPQKITFASRDNFYKINDNKKTDSLWVCCLRMCGKMVMVDGFCFLQENTKLHAAPIHSHGRTQVVSRITNKIFSFSCTVNTYALVKATVMFNSKDWFSLEVCLRMEEKWKTRIICFFTFTSPFHLHT